MVGVRHSHLRPALAGLLGAALTAGIGLAGCAGGSGPGAMGARRSAMTGPVANAAEHDAWAALGYRISWRGFPIVDDREGVRHIAVVDDGVIVQDWQNTVTYMDQRTGANLWVTELGRPLTRFVGLAMKDDSVLVSSDHELYFLDRRTGDLTARQSLEVVVNTPPVIMGNYAIYGSATGEALGHSLYSGFKAWGYKLSGSIDAKPVPMGDVVGLVSQSGDVIMINAATGASTGRAKIFNGVRSDPVTDGQSMFVASLDQSVYAFASQDGRRLWRKRNESPITAQPVWAEGVVYVETPGEGLVALDALTGDVIWSNAELSGVVVAARDDLVLIWDGAAMVTVLADNGDIVERVSMPNVVDVIADGFADADLYATLKSGAVVKVIAD